MRIVPVIPEVEFYIQSSTGMGGIEIIIGVVEGVRFVRRSSR